MGEGISGTERGKNKASAVKRGKNEASAADRGKNEASAAKRRKNKASAAKRGKSGMNACKKQAPWKQSGRGYGNGKGKVLRIITEDHDQGSGRE
ncbi:MAG: hypothetical protein IKH28_05840 [Lachnospiraceae bacterium]|nr:hypothetical protein [Lachnospiraceae bacterium]